jgi:ABC-2 type transport system permease protein
MDAGLHLRARHPAQLPARRAGRAQAPAMQLNVDATRMSQAFTGSGYIQQIVAGEVGEFVQRYRAATATGGPGLAHALQPGLNKAWFGSLMEIINNVTMLSIILTGAALIREREHGTIEHLLVMPVTPTRSCWPRSGRWAGGAAGRRMSLHLVVQGLLQVPIEGSLPLFMAGRRCTCSPPPPWASSWPRWRAACRSSAC